MISNEQIKLNNLHFKEHLKKYICISRFSSNCLNAKRLCSLLSLRYEFDEKCEHRVKEILIFRIAR